MPVTVKQEGGVTVASVVGKFDDLVSEKIEALARGADGAGVRLVIDLSGARPLVSSGLAGLIKINDAVRAAGGVLVLGAPSEDVRSVLELTNLLPVFTVAGDLASAKKAAGGE